ncbi:MAG: DUF4040 domain-containing protein [Defluviitaleaceae bacterium]|nr:DUF4040 domain-containing protein [Defluviitaleaceae bacterium]
MEITQILLAIWLFVALFIVFESRVYRIIIYFGIFSLISSVIYLFMGAPDVAKGEAAVSAFATIFFIICAEKYYVNKADVLTEKKPKFNKGRWITKIVLPLLFVGGLFMLFMQFIPEIGEINTQLKDQYLARFMTDVGGENAVTAIYLGYRVYDTLFEALILVIVVVAVAHVSWYEKGDSVTDGYHSEIENYNTAIFTMRIIWPIILLFGVYLIMNGHISAGGGFQGGLAIACFFICRYMIYGIYDIPIKKVIRLEELVFLNIIIMAILAIFLGAENFIVERFPVDRGVYQTIYLLIMNILIGLKVACGFFILFYRYIAIERLDIVQKRNSKREK